jgi:acetyl-CoA decarbonylase/synthase, CODH/ACS complex subunit gamma
VALTGLQINKLLPGTNCKECGSSTCLAFAMKMAAKKAEIAQCPYASEEAKKTLGAASEPPMRPLAAGPNGEVKLGGETVLYRHEKTLVSPTALTVNLDASEDAASLDRKLAQIRDYKLDRVGEAFQVDMVGVTQGKASSEAFINLARKAWETTKKPLVLKSSDSGVLAKAAEVVKGSRSILASANASNAETLVKAASGNGHLLAVTGPDLDSIAGLTAKIKAGGFNDLLLEFPGVGLRDQFLMNSISRRSALLGDVKALGYPSLRFLTGDLAETSVAAITEIAKYGSIVVLPEFDPAQLSTLLTLRLNLYTDPQKPIQVEPKVYPIGEPKPNSPVFVTTNFSLTYFIVSGEIENTGISAWLVVPECEGMSVLTAWAAGKFNGIRIAQFIKESGLEAQVQTRQIVIPGYVSTISGELEENLPGWKALVGPQEAGDIESFVKSRL